MRLSIRAASLSPLSFSIRSAPYTAWSALLRVSISSLRLLVFLGVRLGVLHHPIDLVLAEAARRGDGDLLFLAGAESLADTLTMPLASMSKVTSICGTPRGAGGMPIEMEPAQRAVVARQRPLALQHVHFDAGLAVGRRRERLALARRNRRVPRNQRRHHAAERLDAERQRRDVEQQQVLHLAREHAGLDGRADRDDFVGIHALVRLLARTAP